MRCTGPNLVYYDYEIILSLLFIINIITIIIYIDYYYFCYYYCLFVISFITNRYYLLFIYFSLKTFMSI